MMLEMIHSLFVDSSSGACESDPIETKKKAIMLVKSPNISKAVDISDICLQQQASKRPNIGCLIKNHSLLGIEE